MKFSAALLFPALLAAQAPEFGVHSRLVLVPVSVTDAKGRTVDGLEPADFTVIDNGLPQTAVVDSFTTGVAPVALMIAVQSSGISAPVLAKVQKIGAMIQPLITGERGCAGLVAFDERVHWLADCTKNPDALTQAFRKLRPGEEKGARMLDAVQETIEHLRGISRVRRVLLLISESRDRGSETELEAVTVSAQAAGVSVYASTYSAFKTAFTTKAAGREAPPEPRETRPNRTEPLSPEGRVPIPPPEQRTDILGGIGELIRLGKIKDTEVLTRATGGAAYPFTRQKGLEQAIGKLGAELHSQYLLAFAPDAPAPGYHSLEVRVTRPGKFLVRARPGYWSTH